MQIAFAFFASLLIGVLEDGGKVTDALLAKILPGLASALRFTITSPFQGAS